MAQRCMELCNEPGVPCAPKRVAPFRSSFVGSFVAFFSGISFLVVVLWIWDVSSSSYSSGIESGFLVMMWLGKGFKSCYNCMRSKQIGCIFILKAPLQTSRVSKRNRHGRPGNL